MKKKSKDLFFKKTSILRGLPYLLLVPLFLITYKTNNFLINSFGCFDDCHVFSTAYFMLAGKKIYSEVFFNHNPLMPYFSVVIQHLYNPSSIYELLLRHRQTIFYVSFFFNILLLIRFKYKALGFIILFELTKYYTFGNRFLPESIIVYPLVYLFGVGWEKIKNRNVKKFDLLISAVACWFVVFMREPYVPLALFLYGWILYKPFGKNKLVSLGLFLVLSGITLLSIPIKDFYFNVVTFNLSETVSQEISGRTFLGLDIIKVIFYPFFILFPTGDFNYYRQLLIFESLFFIILLIVSFKTTSRRILLFLFLALALANIRFTQPGVTFYSAFHMNVWYGLFIFSLMYLLFQVKEFKLKVLCFGFYICIILFAVSKNSIIWERPNLQEQLLTNYGQQLLHISLINLLSDSEDTLFLDGWDELIYSQTKLSSSYKYSHFTSQMPNIKLYQDARQEMFNNYPPVFYYGTCREDVGQKLPESLRSNYVRVYHLEKPTCLYVLRSKYEKIKINDPQVSFEYGKK